MKIAARSEIAVPAPRSYSSLFLAALLPLVLFASAIAVFIGVRERDNLNAVAQSKVQEIAAGIDRYVASQLKAAEVMSQMPSLREGNLERFYGFASRLKAQEKAWANVVVIDGAGQQLINLAAPFGTPLPSATDLPALNLAIAQATPSVGDLVPQGPVYGKMFIPLRVPFSEAGQLKYVVVVDLDPVELSGLFKLSDAPPDWVGAIVDRNGRLIGRSTLADEFVGKFATPVALEAIKQSKRGFYSGRTLEGLDTEFAFSVSPLTGWTVHYAVPRATYGAPLQRAVLTVVVGALIAVALAAGLLTLIARDGSRYRRIEQDRADALELSETRLRSVFETSYQYQLFMTPEGILLDANPTSLAGIDARLEEVVGRPFWECPWFAQTPALREDIRAAIPAVAAGETFRREIEMVLAAGHRAFDFSMRPVRSAAGAIVAIVPEAMEITQRKEAEAMLRQSQKMEAIGQLTGGIAHDFNNMLAVIIGSVSLAKRNLARGAMDLDRFLDGALDGAQRAATLTRRLLAFSRQQPLSPQPLEINRLVSGMADLIRRTIGETLRFETVLGGGVWMTRADPSELENALLNLAINARDAMIEGNKFEGSKSEGGKLTIETSNASLDESYCLQHDDVAAGQYVLVAVTDTGSGMAPEILQKAFDPFFSTKAAGQGTGLGLSQVFGFVRQSGGHVKIYSEVGVGTTVKIYLQRYNGKDGGLPAGAEPLSIELPRARAGEVVLVAEDDDYLRDVTCANLKELGYTVIAAESGAAALRQLDQNPGAAVDLLFTDIVMPEMNGRRLAEEALRRRPGLKILYTTGYTKNAVVHNGILDSGVNLIVKPYAIDDLARKVREAIDAAKVT
jgi:PAS domain S-box-containing protein